MYRTSSSKGETEGGGLCSCATSVCSWRRVGSLEGGHPFARFTGDTDFRMRNLTELALFKLYVVSIEIRILRFLRPPMGGDKSESPQIFI